MQYLNHLNSSRNKSSENKREYRMQKGKVKYLMELFWKNTNTEEDVNI